MTFVERFRRVALRDGGRVALEHGARRVTYEALDAHALAIAAHLRARDVGADDVVAIRSDDRIAIITGMLGVWFAGAAFVVITSDVPAARARRMESDARVRETLDDSILRRVADLAHGDVAAMPSERDLAYVVFTSGTTGTPKGVLVTHAGIVPMLDAQIETFELDTHARATWILSPLFDASISDIGTALLAGATLVMCDVADAAPREIAARIEALGITHADLPPSLLALLCDAIPVTLRTIVVGGEACAARVVERVATHVRLVNVYGPTEATVCTSMHVCRAGERHAARIGTPLAHVKYVVENEELFIAGSALARGYANDDALTAQRFVERDGQRFYRTGDRVRVRPEGNDGELEIIGRIDRQVKIAGVRIEPEEIESKLRDDDAVIEAAVIARERALHAYVVLCEGARVDDVRDRLVASVPRWLVPLFFVARVLPRTASGKVDYAQLAAEHGEEAGKHGAMSVEANEIERTIASALASALGRDAMGVDDDFVVAGGDSLALLAACAAADARGVILSPETIAKARTARRVAASRDVCGVSTDELTRDVAAVHVVCAPAAHASVRSVFVTGATGTLGAHLIRSLVRRGASVTCLVRAHDDEGARARIVHAFGDLPRVRAIAGDVALDHFGLAEAHWESLTREHDAILHAAADLRLTSTYASLRDTNVLGACHAADFANHGAPKTLHHISTLSVFASTDLGTRASSKRTFDEGMNLHSARIVHGGYAQSKWAAEVAVRGAHVTRLGLLLPSSREAASSQLFGAFVRAACVVGALPEGDAWRFDVTPVDFAANAIASFVMRAEAPRVRHVANRESVTMDDLAHAIECAGVPLERVSLDAFRRRVLACGANISALALASFRALTSDDDASRAFDLFEATHDLGAGPTLGELARDGITCPPATSVLASIVRECLP